MGLIKNKQRFDLLSSYVTMFSVVDPSTAGQRPLVASVLFPNCSRMRLFICEYSQLVINLRGRLDTTRHLCSHLKTHKSNKSKKPLKKIHSPITSRRHATLIVVQRRRRDGNIAVSRSGSPWLKTQTILTYYVFQSLQKYSGSVLKIRM